MPRTPAGAPRAAWLVRAFLVLLAAWLIGSAAAGPPTKPLLWAADAEGGQPYVFLAPGSTTEVIGFEKDIADGLARELGQPIQFKQYDFKSLIAGLERGDFDLAMNGYEITADRQQRLRFTRPYYTYRLQLVARAADHRFDDLATLAKLPQPRVGTLTDCAAGRVLASLGIDARTYDDQEKPYLDLEQGQLDAVLLDLPIALYAAAPEQRPPLRYVGEPTHPGHYAIAVARTNDELANRLDAALDRLRASGELRRILEKWRLWDDAQSLVATAAPTAEPWTLPRILTPLLEGAGMTLLLSSLSMALAVVLGLQIALVRLHGPWPLRLLAIAYVEFFRGIPILLLLLLVYYGLPLAAEGWGLGGWFKLGPITAAVLSFGLNYAAYESEIYRAGLAAVPVGQWEAAASLGMSPTLAFQRIILPQALRFALPPMTNDFIGLFKDTSVVSVIAVTELTKQYSMVSIGSQRHVEVALATVLLYLVMSIPLGWLARWLERRWGDEA